MIAECWKRGNNHENLCAFSRIGRHQIRRVDKRAGEMLTYQNDVDFQWYFFFAFKKLAIIFGMG